MLEGAKPAPNPSPETQSGEIFPIALASQLPKAQLFNLQCSSIPLFNLQGPVFACSLWSPADALGRAPVLCLLLQAAMPTSALCLCLLPMQVGTTSVPASDKSCGGQGISQNNSQNNCQGLHRSKTPAFPPQSCSSAPGGSDASHAAAEGTAIYYLLLLIILGFKFIYYVCKNGNTLASECLLGIQYPYYSKWFFLHN